MSATSHDDDGASLVVALVVEEEASGEVRLVPLSLSLLCVFISFVLLDI